MCAGSDRERGSGEGRARECFCGIREWDRGTGKRDGKGGIMRGRREGIGRGEGGEL